MSLFERIRFWLEEHLTWQVAGVLGIIAILVAFWAGGQYDRWQGTSQLVVVDDVEERKEIQTDALPEAPVASEVLLVHVAGAVEKPGVYELSADNRINDALEKAGVKTDADIEQLNLAQRLMDGQKIIVPYIGEDLATAPTAAPATGGGETGRISINQASEAELMTLPAIGEVRAKAIIAYREENGGFKSVDELKNVSGIGDKTFAQLESLVSL